MNRRAEFLVSKRDGQKEWLRATKLARSIHLAMAASGANETWRAIDIASTVLMGLRSKLGTRSALSTCDIALASQQVLAALGFVASAEHYARVGASQRRRQRLLGELMKDRRDRGSPASVSEAGLRRGLDASRFPSGDRFSHN